LIGEWASDQGRLDAAFSHSKGEVLSTPYLEKLDEFPEPFAHTDRNTLRTVG
jgi:hypothetical protein